MSAIEISVSESIKYSELFMIKDPLATRPLRLSPREQNWLHGQQVDSLFKGEWQPPEPVILQAIMGGSIVDFLWTDYIPLLCISDRIIDLLLNNHCTGWSTYPVKVYDRQKNYLPGYHGLAIKHSVGEIEINRSGIITKPPMTPKGRPRRVYKGIFFDENKWDGSDIFRIESFFMIVTKKVRDILKQSKITNIRLTALSEVELDTIIFKARTKN
jgi:hypothetical protein